MCVCVNCNCFIVVVLVVLLCSGVLRIELIRPLIIVNSLYNARAIFPTHNYVVSVRMLCMCMCVCYCVYIYLYLNNVYIYFLFLIKPDQLLKRFNC